MTRRTPPIATLLISGLLCAPTTGLCAFREENRSAPAPAPQPSRQEYSRPDPVAPPPACNPPRETQVEMPRPSTVTRPEPTTPEPKTLAPTAPAPTTPAPPLHRRADVTGVIGWPRYYENNNIDYGPDASGASDNNANNVPAAPIVIAPVIVAPAIVAPANPAPFVPAGPSPIALAARAVNAVNKDPQMVAANTELADSHAAYTAERNRVTHAWEADPSHQPLLAQKQKAVDNFDAAESTGQPESALLQAAREKLNASSPITQLLEQTIASDPRVIAARKRLDTAVANRDALWKTLLAQQ